MHVQIDMGNYGIIQCSVNCSHSSRTREDLLKDTDWVRNENWEGVLLKVTQIKRRVASINERPWLHRLPEVLSVVYSTKHPHDLGNITPNSVLGNIALPTRDWHLHQLQHCNEEQWYPAFQYFIIHPLLGFIIQLFSFHFLYALSPSQTAHYKAKFICPSSRFTISFYFQVCCWLSFLTCHDMTVSIIFSCFP